MTKFEVMDLQISKIRDLGLDEMWLQDRIEEDPSKLGLGDLDLIERERKQSSGGRIDFLFNNIDLNTMFEVEVMVGTLDESHIIRTIEYWDIEKRRFPNKDHKAVIIAEDITNRFFNILSLMNKSIPIIAIQLSVIKQDNKIGLLFTKVLDIYEYPEDELQLDSEELNRDYWEKKSNSLTMNIVDQFINIAKKYCEDLKITYNKYHIALGAPLRNVIWLHPRKTPGYCHVEMIVGESNTDAVTKLIEDNVISYRRYGDDGFAFPLQVKVLNEKTEIINQIVELSIKAYSQTG